MLLIDYGKILFTDEPGNAMRRGNTDIKVAGTWHMLCLHTIKIHDLSIAI